MNKKLRNSLPVHSSSLTKQKVSKILAFFIVIFLYSFISLIIYWRTGTTPFNFHDAQDPIENLKNLFFMKPDDKITLTDIFFSVKTSNSDDNKKLPLIIKTWFQLARNQIWFFTDANREAIRNLTRNQTNYLRSLGPIADGHVVETNCLHSDKRRQLCCMVSSEYHFFITTNKKWFCSFEDDYYVNVPQVVEVLQKYDYKEDWYLGRDNKNHAKNKGETKSHCKSIWNGNDIFGGGMCMTRTLMLKLTSSGNDFIEFCENTKYPVDVRIGQRISNSTKKNLTALPEFHSHHESMKLIPKESFSQQISFPYSKDNVLNVPGFNDSVDPTRILSLHCYLFPLFDFCRRS